LGISHGGHGRRLATGGQGRKSVHDDLYMPALPCGIVGAGSRLDALSSSKDVL